jgi:hypothetical protein
MKKRSTTATTTTIITQQHAERVIKLTANKDSRSTGPQTGSDRKTADLLTPATRWQGGGNIVTPPKMTKKNLKNFGLSLHYFIV